MENKPGWGVEKGPITSPCPRQTLCLTNRWDEACKRTRVPGWKPWQTPEVFFSPFQILFPSKKMCCFASPNCAWVPPRTDACQSGLRLCPLRILLYGSPPATLLAPFSYRLRGYCLILTNLGAGFLPADMLLSTLAYNWNRVQRVKRFCDPWFSPTQVVKTNPIKMVAYSTNWILGSGIRLCSTQKDEKSNRQQREKPAAAGSPRELALNVTGMKLLQILPKEAGHRKLSQGTAAHQRGQNSETKSPKDQGRAEWLQRGFWRALSRVLWSFGVIPTILHMISEGLQNPQISSLASWVCKDPCLSDPLPGDGGYGSALLGLCPWVCSSLGMLRQRYLKLCFHHMKFWPFFWGKTYIQNEVKS